MFQSIGIFPHLIPDIKLILCPKLRKYIIFFRHSVKTLLIPGNHTPGNILLHGRLITVFKPEGPVHAQPFVIPIDLTPACIEVHLTNPQIVHAEGMEHIMAPLLKLPDQIPTFQGRYDEVCRRLKDI